MNKPFFKSTIGVNFSNTFQSSGKQVTATTAATQIKSIGVGVVKMFTYHQADCISALIAEGLQVIVDVPNDDLAACAKNDATTINSIISVLTANADSIPMICVGNEPLGSWWNGAFTVDLVPALKYIRAAIKLKGLATKVTVPFNYAIMGNSYPPSLGALNSSDSATVLDVCAILKEDDSVFMVNVYPFITQNSNRQIALDYCLFTADKDSSVWVVDGDYTYRNIFDAMYDALYVALGNNGYGDLPIVIGEAGWPTESTVAKETYPYPSATTANALTFNQNLIDHCKSGNGTPRVPNIDITCFLFEMYDEDTKPTGDGNFEHYWGVYSYDDTHSDYKVKYTLSW